MFRLRHVCEIPVVLVLACLASLARRWCRIGFIVPKPICRRSPGVNPTVAYITTRELKAFLADSKVLPNQWHVSFSFSTTEYNNAWNDRLKNQTYMCRPAGSRSSQSCWKVTDSNSQTVHLYLLSVYVVCPATRCFSVWMWVPKPTLVRQMFAVQFFFIIFLSWQTIMKASFFCQDFHTLSLSFSDTTEEPHLSTQCPPVNPQSLLSAVLKKYILHMS